MLSALWFAIPCSAAWRKCSIIHVSDSSCWQGDRDARSISQLLSTMFPFILKTWYFASAMWFWSFWLMNWETWTLFWLYPRSFYHYSPFSKDIVGETRVHCLVVPPLLVWVRDFKLNSLYVSQTSSTQTVLCIVCFCKYVTNCICVHSQTPRHF